jgi:predicted ArsR family transcriptional regulator
VDTPAAQGDVLAQPTRARLFRLLAELQRPAGTDELAAHLQLHPNGVRTHLERLRDAGLVVRAREARPRGRPRDRGSVAPQATPLAEPPTAYADLSRWLVRDVASRSTPVRSVQKTGRTIGNELAQGAAPGPPEERMHAALVALGFRPERGSSPEDGLTYTLRNCPYRDAVRENQPVVCAFHRGLTRGLLDGISPRSTLTAFEPHDPYVAGCRIRVRGPLAAEAAARERALIQP